jgi:hypothetical protein
VYLKVPFGQSGFYIVLAGPKWNHGDKNEINWAKDATNTAETKHGFTYILF